MSKNRIVIEDGKIFSEEQRPKIGLKESITLSTILISLSLGAVLAMLMQAR